MVNSATLTRDINYVEGPEGQVVVVVQPNQRRVGEMHIVIEHIGYTLCAISWGVVALPFTIIGFSLICVGLSKMKSDPGHHVLTVGLVFFHIGLVTTALFCISMYCFKKEQKKKVAKFMHNPCQRSPAEDQQPMLPTSVEEAREELTPYQRFMLHRETEVNSSDTSPLGVQTPFSIQVSSSPFQERNSFPDDRRTDHLMGSGLPQSSVSPTEPNSTSSNGFRILQSVSEEPSVSNDESNYAPVTSEVSLEDILSSVQTFSLSSEALNGETRSFPRREVSQISPTVSSGRESPYDNCFSLT